MTQCFPRRLKACVCAASNPVKPQKVPVRVLCSDPSLLCLCPAPRSPAGRCSGGSTSPGEAELQSAARPSYKRPEQQPDASEPTAHRRSGGGATDVHLARCNTPAHGTCCCCCQTDQKSALTHIRHQSSSSGVTCRFTSPFIPLTCSGTRRPKCIVGHILKRTEVT